MNDSLDVLEQLALTRQEQASLLAQVDTDARELLDRLAALCEVRGPFKRSEIPAGIFKFRERKPAAAPAKRARKPKGQPSPEAAE